MTDDTQRREGYWRWGTPHFVETGNAESRVCQLEDDLERIRAHVRSYGMTPEGERDGRAWTLADVIEQGFVSHCAVGVCSAANQPRSHWCKRHENSLTELLVRVRQLEDIERAAREVIQEYGFDQFGHPHLDFFRAMAALRTALSLRAL